MTNSTNKNIEFLSNPELVDILRTILDEIDVVVSAGAHRSTTYLAVSAIEGLFGEILKLRRIDSTTVPTGCWPKDKSGNDKKPDKLTLEERENILKAAGALPSDFEEHYRPARNFRNYMHPDREIKKRTPIGQSVGQSALACLNALIEKYKSRRFLAMEEWQLIYGLAEVRPDNVISMPQQPASSPFASLLVSEKPAESFQKVTFRVKISPDAIFNFIYNFTSKNDWMAARIEGRVRADGKGCDNGKLSCTQWGVWNTVDRYTANSEPSPKKQQHTMQVALDPPGTFALTVDGKTLTLKDGVSWDFDRHGKIGFMTEQGQVSVMDLEVKAR